MRRFLDASTEPLKSHSLTATCTTGEPKIGTNRGKIRRSMYKADLSNIGR